mgnify:CR=1 FL=1
MPRQQTSLPRRMSPRERLKDVLGLVRLKVVRNLHAILDERRCPSNRTLARLASQEACIERASRLQVEVDQLLNNLAASREWMCVLLQYFILDP